MDLFHKANKSLISAMSDIFGKSLILGADETEDETSIEYLMCSYHFKEISPGDEIPRYVFQIAPNGSVVWSEFDESS
jgi:hypothetical protein